MVALSHILKRSRMGTDRVLRAWLVAWLGGSVLGVINGVAREVLYKDRVGDQAANYISTGTLLALLAFYLWLLQRRWPIRSRGTAYGIGASGVVLTIMFEFGLTTTSTVSRGEISFTTTTLPMARSGSLCCSGWLSHPPPCVDCLVANLLENFMRSQVSEGLPVHLEPSDCCVAVIWILVARPERHTTRLARTPSTSQRGIAG